MRTTIASPVASPTANPLFRSLNSAARISAIARAPATCVPRENRNVCQKRGVPIEAATSATLATPDDTSRRMNVHAMHIAPIANATFVHASTTAYKPPKPSAGPPIQCAIKYGGAERIDVPIPQ